MPSPRNNFFLEINFPFAIASNTIADFNNWWETSTPETHRKVLDLLSEDYNFDYEEEGSRYIRRRFDNAVLIGGWTFSTEHNAPSINPYGPGNTEVQFSGFIPFEWWDIQEDEIVDDRTSGFEPVYKDSIELHEVIHFLLWDLYYKTNDISLYVGRYLYMTNTVAPLYNNYCSAIHGSSGNLDDGYSAQTINNIYTHNGKRMDTQLKKERTLLYLIRKINSKWDELIKNEGAYTWLWFNNSIRAIVRHRVIHSDDESMTGVKMWNIILKKMKRLTGHEWVFLGTESGILPQKMCKSYYHLATQDDNSYATRWTADHIALQWLKATKWDKMKAAGSIIWDDEEKMWWSARAKLNVKYRKEDGKAGLKVSITNYKFFKENERCDTCGYYVVKTEIETNEDLEICGCKFCYPDGLTTGMNHHVNQANCYGGYHTHGRYWRFFYQRTPLDDPRSFCVGMELEIHNKDKNKQDEAGAKAASWNILQAQWAIDEDLNNCYFERDGSLSPGGLEMVTNPMSLAYHQWYWTLMLPEIRKYCVGWNTEQFCGASPQYNNYGIHMTFSRRWWTDLQLARLIKFIDNPDNLVFVQSLAQRHAIYNGEVLADKKQVLSNKVQLRNGKITTGLNRYVPVNVKNKLVEIRFFRSTLNTESFLKNIEWLFAFHEWVKTTPFNTQAATFLMWLAGNQRAHGKYSNLIRYLSREKFPVKQIGHHKNPWRPMFTDIRNKKPLIFPIEPTIRQTTENILQGDMECV